MNVKRVTFQHESARITTENKQSDILVFFWVFAIRIMCKFHKFSHLIMRITRNWLGVRRRWPTNYVHLTQDPACLYTEPSTNFILEMKTF